MLIFLAGESPSTERILGAAETASTAADPGVAIAQRLAAAVFSSGNAQPPAFGVVAPTTGGMLVLLRGAVRAVVDGPEGTRQLSGVRAMTWVDEILRDPVRRVTVVGETDAGTEIPHTDLRSGVAAAGGFVLHAPRTGITAPPRTANTGSSKAVQPETHPATPTSGVPPIDSTKRVAVPTPSHTRFSTPGSEEPLRRPSAGALDLTKKPPPESAAPGAEQRPDPADQPPTAAFNSNAAAAEEGGGTHAVAAVGEEPDPPTEKAGSPNAQSPAPRVMPLAATPEPETDKLGPPHGALITVDGAIYPMDRRYVIGRDPMTDDSVRRGAAVPIVIPRDRHVSRIHAYVFTENGVVLVRDAATPGGTFVAGPGQDWIRVGQRPSELKAGWSLRVGDRILTYHQDRRR
ncbi:FHA domain-containing protein [Nocardia sp. NBC_01327]|uniref:FHA domain-containing protein n=1 Tax=Nocardia sp. NBC_01327 TaxID=2903593 RepID=UPI002E158E72|nr:FHA domain-containing protein [Nocardia sp. NBC_01327]